MKLATLIHNLPIRAERGSIDVEIASITEDSRNARPGSLFIARPGLKRDGRSFICGAVDAGAVAVLTDDAGHVPSGAVALVSDDVPRAAALLAERFTGHPTGELLLIGVTGTNGKTTTAFLIQQIINRAASAAQIRRCGMVGTVLIDDGRTARQAELTTPPAIALSRLFQSMIDHGCDAAVMEVSSHALDQRRVDGLAFDIAIFTNLTGDHLDYHGTEDAYITAKARLFEMLPESGWAIVNCDDPAATHMLKNCGAQYILRCSLGSPAAECRADIRVETISHIDAAFHGPWGSFELRLPLCGRHNVMNALQAAAAGHAAGLDRAAIHEALSACTAPPGRLEPVAQPGDPVAVYVDYAHTDDALKNVLRSLRPLVQDERSLWVVFGCGGDRDRTKRSRMARAAWSYADRVIVTSDNPRTEDPAAIVEEIRAGVPINRRAVTLAIVDRHEAIVTAINRAAPGDVIIIAGKGHEDYQIIGETKRPFDDRLVAADALRRRREASGSVSASSASIAGAQAS